MILWFCRKWSQDNSPYDNLIMTFLFGFFLDQSSRRKDFTLRQSWQWRCRTSEGSQLFHPRVSGPNTRQAWRQQDQASKRPGVSRTPGNQTWPWPLSLYYIPSSGRLSSVPFIQWLDCYPQKTLSRYVKVQLFRPLYNMTNFFSKHIFSL